MIFVYSDESVVITPPSDTVSCGQSDKEWPSG